MDNPGEILRLCRLCLVKDQVNIPIFEEQGDIRQTFLKIRSCLPVKVSRDDKLPKKICGGCSNKLDLFYEFWSSTANSEKTLQSWLGQEEEDDKMQEITKPVEALVKEESEALEDGHAHDQSFDEATKDEAEAPPAKRARRTAAVKAQINISHDSDEDEDVDGAEPITKIEDESDDSDGEEKDPSYTEVPGTSADDQAGPSGLGKDGVEAPLEIILLEIESEAESTQLSSSTQSKFYQCTLCPSKFNRLFNLKRHQSVHDKVKLGPTQRKHSCKDCGATFSCVSSLKRHILGVHLPGLKNAKFRKNEVRLCFTCGKLFYTQELLQKHVTEEHETEYKCSYCSASFQHEKALQAHVKQKHLKQFEYFCSLCSEGFVLAADFRFHKESIHQPKKSCRFCQKLFPSSRDLKIHMSKHLKSGHTQQCPVCNEFCWNLKMHMRMNHSEEDKTWTCEICEKEFKIKHSYNLHMKIHYDMKNFTCEICGKRFLTRHHLKVHTRTHTGEKPHECEVCGVRFAYRGTLIEHFTIHSGEKPFRCEHCGKNFSRRKYLVSHYKSC
ncbi:zinc finger protein 658B-like isoform X33 [Euwallacea similis]|uniref:zinc finger protein 658B-like isoform X33 n=1 Tax=Euwallacea similis TaxID=1736056 RepID=UPI00344DCCE3